MRRLLFLTGLAILSTAALASYSAEAFNNATIQAAGPRSGTNGKAFFNMEGPANGSFASWGAADFNADDFGVGFTVADVSNFQVVLTEADAAFTMPGVLNFWLTTDTTNSIDPGTSPFVWQANVTPEGVGSQLPLIYLGSGQFTTTGNTATGQIDTYPIVLSADAKNYLVNALNSHGTVRLIVTTDSVNGPDTVAATFAGFSHTTYPGPSIVFDATEGSTTETLAPNGNTINLGKVSSGDLSSLAADDGNALTVCKFIVPSQTSPIVRMTQTYTTTKPSPTAVELDVKAKLVNAGAFKIRGFQHNYSTSSDDQVIADTTLTLSYATYTGTASGTLTNYVSGGAMQTKVEVQQTGPSTVTAPCVSFEFINLKVTG